MDQNIRQLKVYRKCRTRVWDTTSVPEIKLEGVWLEKLGYTPGTGVPVSEEPNKLTISLDENAIIQQQPQKNV